MSKRFASAIKEPLVGWDAFAFEMKETILDADGEVIYETPFREVIPNQLTNAGQDNMLSVWARATAASNQWLFLLNQGTLGPSKASTFSNITEAVTINTNGYARVQISPTDWSVAALNAGDMQISSGQKTFGPFTGNVPVTHVGLASTASQFAGIFFLYVPTAYFTANSSARTFVNGESYLVTLQSKQQ